MTLDQRMPELAFALAAVRAATRAAQLVAGRMDVKGIEKRDLSPVTVADYACQALVAKKLGEDFPDAILVGEEDASDLRKEESGETMDVAHGCDLRGKARNVVAGYLRLLTSAV